MNDLTGERLTSDLEIIRGRLAQATRRDVQRRTRRRTRRRVARAGAIAALGTAGLSASAFGAAALTGVVDLHPTVRSTTSTTASSAPEGSVTVTGAHAYDVHGRPTDSTSPRAVFLVSQRQLAPAVVERLRQACAVRGVPEGAGVGGGDMWVNISLCAAAHP